MTVVIADNLKKGDAKKLRSWWDANTPHYHFVRKMDNGKYWELVRQTTNPTTKHLFK